MPTPVSLNTATHTPMTKMLPNSAAIRLPILGRRRARSHAAFDHGLGSLAQIAAEQLHEGVHLFGGADCEWVASQLSRYARSESDRLSLLLDSGELNPPQEKVLRDLMEFQRTTFDERGKCLEDVNHVDNWGKIYREGWPVLIVTDFGL